MRFICGAVTGLCCVCVVWCWCEYARTTHIVGTCTAPKLQTTHVYCRPPSPFFFLLLSYQTHTHHQQHLNQALLKALAPYDRVALPHLAKELNGVPEAEVK